MAIVAAAFILRLRWRYAQDERTRMLLGSRYAQDERTRMLLCSRYAQDERLRCSVKTALPHE